MIDMDHQIWNLIQNVISARLNEGFTDIMILEDVMKLTHGVADYDAIRREIVRQKRGLIN